MGTTNKRGEVVVSPMLSFYDNYLNFDQRAVPLDYVFTRSRLVVSPAFRSGSFLAFDVKENRAAFGRLEQEIQQQRVPIEFRELIVMRADVEIRAFTGRGGEFYIEALDPGEYELRVEADPACVATIRVTDVALMDFGAVLCAPAGR
jgi:outer membrane usher protein